MTKHAERARWVSYLRVSTVEQAEKELSLIAQRHAATDFAGRHGAVIDHEYVEAGASGTDSHRPVLNQLLGDALQPGSTISTIVVHHTSRFTRDATHARIVKSELNGLRTSAAMREAVKQGFYPGARAPYGYRSVPVEVRPGVIRHRLEVAPDEATTLHEMYRLYVIESGAKSVARALNQRGHRTRAGALWDKGAVMQRLSQTAASGVVQWGRHHRKANRPKSDLLTLAVEPIIDAKTYALAQELRARREPARSPGRAAAKPHLLSGLVFCGPCGSSYQLETSGKRIDGTVYRYSYYNCRAACRTGIEACAGFRIATDVLDAAVLAAIADIVCTAKRAERLARRRSWSVDAVLQAWRALVACDAEIGRAYALHLVERIEVHSESIVVTPKLGGRTGADATHAAAIDR